jgi:hypothetical protein
MFNNLIKWFKADSNTVPMPRSKESVKTKIHQKWIDLEIQRKQSRKLQSLIDHGMHTALPKHCISKMKKVKHTWSSSKI